jgi:hypothetical protein
MENLRTEVVLLDDSQLDKKEAKGLIQDFLSQTGDDITAETREVVDNDGSTREELSNYTRKSDVFWISVAILAMSDPDSVLQFLKWASNIPGLTIGYIDAEVKLKIFSEIDFTLIDNSTEISIEEHGKVEEYKKGEDYVLVSMSEDDWIHLYDMAETGELDIDLPEEDKIGL